MSSSRNAVRVRRDSSAHIVARALTPIRRSERVIRSPEREMPPASVVTATTDLSVTVADAPASAGRDRTSFQLLLEAARAEGFEEGFEAGKNEGAAALEAQRTAAVSAAAAHVADAAQRAATERSAVLEEVSRDVVDLVFELLQVLVGRELALGNGAVRDALSRALRLVPEGHDLIVRVHPDCGMDDDDIAELALTPVVDVVRDPTVDPHGCEVTVGPCHVDAQIASALERVRKCLDSLTPASPVSADDFPESTTDDCPEGVLAS